MREAHNLPHQMVDSERSERSEEAIKEINPTAWETTQSEPSVLVGEPVKVDADAAAKYVRDDLFLDEAMDKHLRMKADKYICSFMCVVYAVQFMDKTATSAAAIMGLIPDLHMEGKMYSWVGSSFYLGYLVFEFPMGYVLQRFPIAQTTGVIIVAWGTVVCCSGAAQNYAGFIVTRVLLGALEGAITPSFMVITSQWYKRNEQFTRTLFWFGFNGLGTILGAAIGYGLYTDDSLPIAGWRMLFIILGLITILVGVIFFFHIPNNPSEAWFMSSEERALQVERIRCNKQGYGSKKFKWYQVKEAFVDPRTWIYFLFPVANNIPNGGITNFQAILLKQLGYDSGDALLLSMVSGAVELVGCCATGVLAMYYWNNFRMGWAIFGAAFMVMCLSLLAWCPTEHGQVAGLFLYSYFAPLSFIGIISTISSNTAGRTKKTIASAMMLIGYCVGNLIGPQTFKPSQAHSGYQTAKITMAVCAAIGLLFQVVLTLLNYFSNVKRDRENKKLPDHLVNSEFADLTDFENPEFRYAL